MTLRSERAKRIRALGSLEYFQGLVQSEPIKGARLIKTYRLTLP